MAAIVRIINESRATILASRATIATSYWSRGRGLLGRSGLADGEGLVIRPCNSVHCLFMRFPIDVVYVDRDYRVVRLTPALRPWRLGPIVLQAREVIELPAGTILATGTTLGDQLRLAAA